MVCCSHQLDSGFRLCRPYRSSAQAQNNHYRDWKASFFVVHAETSVFCLDVSSITVSVGTLFFWGRSTRWRGYGFFPVFTTLLNIRFFAWGSFPRLLCVCGAVVICHFSPYFDIGILRGKKLGVLPILEPSTFRLVLRTLPLNHSKLVASSAIYLGLWWQNACILRW